MADGGSRAKPRQMLRMPKGHEVLITCEHGGCRVPGRFRRLFSAHRRLLATHRGYDPGALPLARRLAQRLKAPLVYSQVTRLLVDLNRSLGHRALFSEVTRALSERERSAVLARHYRPYREQVEKAIRAATGRGQKVFHLSVHTFTPVLDGLVRRADVGLLYDPGRRGEAALCRRWREGLQQADGELRIRANYPYRGTADGLTTYLRRRFSADRYLGIELEVNQRFPLRGRQRWTQLQRQLGDSLARVLAVSNEG